MLLIQENIKRAVGAIEDELEERVKEFKRQDKLIGGTAYSRAYKF